MRNIKHIGLASFADGFLKGLAAPMLVYQRTPMPPIPKMPLSAPTKQSDAEALASDWMKIGTDFHLVINKHGR